MVGGAGLLHARIRRCLAIIDELLLSERMTEDERRKLVELKREIFMIKDEVIRIKVEVWGARECIERLAASLGVDAERSSAGRRLRAEAPLIRARL